MASLFITSCNGQFRSHFSSFREFCFPSSPGGRKQPCSRRRGLEVITGIVLAILLVFLNVEKDIGKKQAEIAARREK